MSRRLGFALVMMVGSVGFAALVACSGAGADVGSAENAATGDEGLEPLFPKLYSAYDGTHEFVVPVKVQGVKGVKWSISDPDIADVEAQADGTALVKIRKAGKAIVKASARGLTGEAPLEVTAATAEDWTNGSERYNNGVVWKRGERGDGGVDGGGGGGRGKPDPSLACTNCHANGKADIEHTPMQTGGFTDAELIAIFTKGQKPEGVEQRIMPLERWQRMHQWKMEPEEQKGLVVYLRSLEPKSQGAVDFMGGRGKGKRENGDDTASK